MNKLSNLGYVYEGLKGSLDTGLYSYDFDLNIFNFPNIMNDTS